MRNLPFPKTRWCSSSISSGRSCGYPVPEAAELDGEGWATMVEFFETVAGYLQNAFEDKEMQRSSTPMAKSVVDGALFERMAQAAREVELFPERG